MKDFNTFLKEQLKDRDFSKDYYRHATYFRLADQMILLRKKRGVTQKGLAEKAGTTQTVVSRLENVSVHPSLETVIKLAEALDAVAEVHLIQVEQLKFSDEEEKPQDETPCFDVLKNLFFIEDRPEYHIKSVSWIPQVSWSLTAKPLIHPVAKGKKILEFA